MRPIDADALIADLEYDIELDSNALDCLDLVGSEREGWQFDKDCKQNAVDLLKRAPTIEPQQQWIPCKKRPPEEYGNYLATMNDGDVQECTYSPEKNTPFMRGGWSTCEADGVVFLDIAEVIAWQHLPAPYQDDDKEKK